MSASYNPPFIVFDYETSVDGKGSTEFYRHDFRVDSMATTHRDENDDVVSKFIVGEDAVRAELERIVAAGIPVVAHNIQFEMGVTNCRFPSVSADIKYHADTMRLAQVYDNNGGDSFEIVSDGESVSLDEMLEDVESGDDKGEPKKAKYISLSGLGLSICARRILKEKESHKDEAYAWIRANVPECKKRKEGQYLTRLPADLLERYNVGDTEVTLRLYEHMTRTFAGIKYDWRFDHRLFIGSVRQLVEAKIRGVLVDRESLRANVETVKAEIVAIEKQFLETFADDIRQVERMRLLEAVRGRKTLRGRKKFVERYRVGHDTAVEAVRFNCGSNKQLESLFGDVRRIECKFRTAKGSGSFKSAHLSQWGDGGLILQTRRKRLIVQKQMEALLALSEYDGRWHLDLRACGTATSRYSGGSH
jgi:hypothetical protein